MAAVTTAAATAATAATAAVAAAAVAVVATAAVDMWVTLLAVIAGAVALVGLVIGAAELPHWAASRRHLGRRAGCQAQAGATAPEPPAEARGIRETLLVLGYPTARDGRIHPLQRWRTEIAVRSMSSDGDEVGRDVDVPVGAVDTLLVFSGAATRGAAAAEAEVMAHYAREVLGVPAEQIALETRAHTTKQNLAFAMAYLESATTIKIVSDPLHAARARLYLRQLRPDLASRLIPADDYRPLENLHLKLGTVAYEVTRPLLRHVMPPLRAWHRRHFS
ncbi:YdcF family protein [Pseudofrankia sp. BMG5.37]|uniref:YdcF family protein n=1 Tax=Pseudofrankia sp. BMG5.37 TaxID=3050035 RepID=UPI002895F6E3|nr:YdcF family protein [Pseudofrankia sp. BMG5.37]MDT3444342.1 YdcF family protein [Pseudofrankia sp. BMG5.37]